MARNVAELASEYARTIAHTDQLIRESSLSFQAYLKRAIDPQDPLRYNGDEAQKFSDTYEALVRQNELNRSLLSELVKAEKRRNRSLFRLFTK